MRARSPILFAVLLVLVTVAVTAQDEDVSEPMTLDEPEAGCVNR
jgi:hypothetical protein